MMLWRGIIFGMAMGLLLAGPGCLWLLSSEAEAARFDWQGLNGCVPAAPLRSHRGLAGADHRIELTLSCNERRVEVRVAQFFSQRPGKEAVSGAHGVAEHARGPRRTERVASGLGFEVNQYRFTSEAGEPVLVWQWYGIGSAAHADVLGAKLAQVVQVLTLDPTVSTVFQVATIEDAAGGNRQLLQQTAASLWLAYRERFGA